LRTLKDQDFKDNDKKQTVEDKDFILVLKESFMTRIRTNITEKRIS